MYPERVNGIELFLLGRTLMKLGEEAIPTEGVDSHPALHRSVLIVASDIRAHPGTSVSEIADRTGFPQSKVSVCAARLRKAGAIEATPDPDDRRRLLLHTAQQVSDRVVQIRAASVDGALAAALGTDDPARIAEITAALETLARSLTPQTLLRLRGGTEPTDG
jgi:DNA-binding MarR family transcriptional regulator